MAPGTATAGAEAEIGLIGTITGFASICVGDVEIHYDARTPVEIDGAVAKVEELAVGQVVEVLASGSLPELQARAISTQHVVAGPIETIAAPHVRVLGQDILLGEGTRVESSPGGAPFLLGEGVAIRVSGMRRADGVIVASRVTPLSPSDPVRLSGSLARVGDTGFEVAGVVVQGELPRATAEGRELRVIGRWDGKVLRAERVQAIPSLPFDGRVARVQIEGFGRHLAAGEWKVGDVAVDVSNAGDEGSSPILADPEVRLRVQAQVREQRLVADKVVPLRDVNPGVREGGREAAGAAAARDAMEGTAEEADRDAPPPGSAARPNLDSETASQPGAPAKPEVRQGRPPDGYREGAPAERQGESLPSMDRPGRDLPGFERPASDAAPDVDIQRPDLPRMDRPQRPELPQRPQVPVLPERPPRPERPQPQELPRPR